MRYAPMPWMPQLRFGVGPIILTSFQTPTESSYLGSHIGLQQRSSVFAGRFVLGGA
jgi:hypothetical protein